MSPKSASRTEHLFGLLEARAAASAGHVAARSRRSGAWAWSTWRDLRDAAAAVARSLIDRGVQKGERIALMASTREEWTIADFGILGAGAVTVPIYPTATAEQVAFIARHSGVRTLIAEGRTELTAAGAGGLRELVTFDGVDPGGSVAATPFVELVRSGRRLLDSDAGTFAARRDSVGEDDIATVVYTSGTTGSPRGVTLTHRALLAQTHALLEAFPLHQDDEQLLVLPLAHILGRVLSLLHVASGSRLAYARGPNRLVDDLGEVEPTFFATVPRFLEKMYTVANDSARAEGPLKAALWSWAIDVGKRSAVPRHGSNQRSGLLSAQARYADRLVLARIRKTFGSRLRFVISGGAPLPLELGEWLVACGVPVLPGYGLTEIGGASHVNREGRARIGTVGTALPGYETRILADGEVLLRGPSTTTGYLDDAGGTRSAIDAEGWLHTGDVGKLDADGYLTIVDRKKDVIVTAGGSNVAPQNVENLLTLSPWLSQAIVFGDGKPYLVALLTLDLAACTRWAEERRRPADPSSLLADPELGKLIQLDVDGVNRRGASFEGVRRFTVLARDFTLESGELTELGKLRRQAIRMRYAEQIEALYV